MNFNMSLKGQREKGENGNKWIEHKWTSRHDQVFNCNSVRIKVEEKFYQYSPLFHLLRFMPLTLGNIDISCLPVFTLFWTLPLNRKVFINIIIYHLLFGDSLKNRENQTKCFSFCLLLSFNMERYRMEKKMKNWDYFLAVHPHSHHHVDSQFSFSLFLPVTCSRQVLLHLNSEKWAKNVIHSLIVDKLSGNWC